MCSWKSSQSFLPAHIAIFQHVLQYQNLLLMFTEESEIHVAAEICPLPLQDGK